MFYVLIFSLAALLLVVAGVTTMFAAAPVATR